VKTLFNSGFSTEANERLFIKSSSAKDIVCGFVFGKLYKISVLQLTPNTDFYLKHFTDKYGKPKESNIDSDKRYLWEDNNTALELIAGRQPNILLTDKNLCKNSYKSNLKYQT